jgi:predicted amidohydrolase YtcJ
VDEIAADLVLVNGRVLTFDSGRPQATALAVAGGRIAAVGDAADVKRHRDRRTEVVDLRGATVHRA